jgi:UPF0716 protein FxsA
LSDANILKRQEIMIFFALIVFIILPIAEIAVLIRLADIINLGPTLLLIVATAIIGVYLLRRQGLASLARAQRSMAAGRAPVEGIYDAFGLLLAGAFLLTPGLITDSVGFALLIPSLRHALGRRLLGRLGPAGMMKVDISGFAAGDIGDGGPHHDENDIFEGEIIEGEIIDGEEKGQADTGKKEDGRGDDRAGRGRGRGKGSPWMR